MSDGLGSDRLIWTSRFVWTRPRRPLSAIDSSFCTTTCFYLLCVKVGHDHLYTYSFTILYVYRDMQRMTQ